MNTLMVLLVVLGTIGILTSFVYAEDENNLLDKIIQLENQIESKDAIIFEQIKVISELAKNYKPVYESFSLEKFPDTDGFNPAWLEGEREKILKTCLESSKMGFENNYCKYVQ
ncbi:MAG: hypothetical protein HRU07_07465 [Nitrosopumilus sp.]|nr:hypothetical protein [Nitrosopumilus sp.]NRA05977.1 hypothetical protein [Nitrosopumilus sp.]